MRELPISIHALVKRATFAKALTSLTLTISIHALVKRATVVILKVNFQEWNFNPRPRKEGDTRWIGEILKM